MFEPDAGSASSQPLPSRFLPTVIGSLGSQTSSGKAMGSGFQSHSQQAVSQDDDVQNISSGASDLLLGFSVNDQDLQGATLYIT